MANTFKKLLKNSMSKVKLRCDTRVLFRISLFTWNRLFSVKYKKSITKRVNLLGAFVLVEKINKKRYKWKWKGQSMVPLETLYFFCCRNVILKLASIVAVEATLSVLNENFFQLALSIFHRTPCILVHSGFLKLASYFSHILFLNFLWTLPPPLFDLPCNH